MRKKELTQAQKDYLKFYNYRSTVIKTLIILLVAILICFIFSFNLVDNNPIPLLVFLFILIVYTVITIFISKHLANKHSKLYVAAYGNEPDIIREGLFGELWLEFEWNQYEGLTDGKVVYAEIHNNIIDLQIIRNKHKFCVEINRESIYMVCDEETGTPIEKEVLLSDLEDVRDFFFIVRKFIETNS